MSHCWIERLDRRRLLSALAPDVSWGDGGFLSRQTDVGYLGQDSGGILSTSEGSPQTIDRYTTAGIADPSFHPITAGDEFDQFAVDRQGRVIAFGFYPTLKIARFTTTGTLDTSFGNGGSVVIDKPAGPYDAIAPQQVIAATDGSLYLAATLITNDPNIPSGATRRYAFFHITADGELDASYGTGGFALLPNGTDPTDEPQVLLGVDPANRLFAAAVTTATGTIFYRYTTAGVLDTSFGTAGHVADPHTFADLPNSYAIDAQGRLIALEFLPASGSSAGGARVLRYTTSGDLDQTFGTHGIVDISSPQITEVTEVLVQSDDKILVNELTQVVRLKEDGSFDTTFAPNGRADVTPNNDFRLKGLLPDNSILAEEYLFSSTLNHYVVSIAKLEIAPPVKQGKDGTVFITGTSGDDLIELTSVGASNTLRVIVSGVGSYDFSATAVSVDLGEGDNIFIDKYHADTANLPITVSAGDGNDSIVTGNGDDRILVNGGDDTVSSGGGFDTVDLGTGSNTLDAGTGGGTISAEADSESSLNTITGSGGVWSVTSAEGRNDITLSGDSANIRAVTHASNQISVDTTGGSTIFSGDGDDTISTGAGDDIVWSTGGSDSISTGAGNDIISAAIGNNTILGGDGDDSIHTGIGHDLIFGGMGKDTIRGGDGNDTIDGGGGRDRIFGQGGDDSIFGGSSDDTLIGGLGNDTLIGNQGDDLIVAGDPNADELPSEINFIDGGKGTDRLQRESAGDQIISVESLVIDIA